MGSYVIKWMKEDVVLGKYFNVEGGGYLFKKGIFVYVLYELYQFDFVVYLDFYEWQFLRYIKESIDEKGNWMLIVEIGILCLFGMYLMFCCVLSLWYLVDVMIGGGSYMCKGRVFVVREFMVFMVVILFMYDV